MNTQENTVRTWSSPAVDLFEGDRGYLLVADVPGVEPEAMEVTLERGQLSIRAPRADLIEAGYRRAFQVPDDVDPDGVRATVAEGVLHVALSRHEAHRPRRIKVGRA